MTKRLQRIEFSKYRLYLNFTDHSLAMSQRAIIPKFANIVPALLLSHQYTVFGVNYGQNESGKYFGHLTSILKPLT